MDEGHRRRIRVVLADDHPVVLAGIKALLASDPGVEVVGEAVSGVAALELIRAELPDVAVVDISMPGLNGVELARQLAEMCPEVKVLALTVHEDRAYVQPLLQAGARGYLLKRSAADDLLRAVRAVAAGGIFLDPAVARIALGHGDAPTGTGLSEPDLSPRETDVLRLTSHGFSNKEIAKRLDLSVKTVETYKSRAAEKLGLRNRAQIVRYGAGRGWLDDIAERP